MHSIAATRSALSTTLLPRTVVPLRLDRTARLAWALQLGGAAWFSFDGMVKLTRSDAMLALTTAVETGPWLRYVVGSVQLVSALALLFPRFAGLGAAVLSATLFWSIVAHTVLLVGSPIPAFIWLALMWAVVWLRREDTRTALGFVEEGEQEADSTRHIEQAH